MSVGVRPQSHVSVPSHRPAVQPVRQDRSARRQKSILGAVARWLWHFLGYTLFALMLVVPTQLQVVKLALMIFLLVSIIVYSGVRRTWDIHPYIVRWTLIMVVMGGGGVSRLDQERARCIAEHHRVCYVASCVFGFYCRNWQKPRFD